jgi:CRP-like cAMP-binding protein
MSEGGIMMEKSPEEALVDQYVAQNQKSEAIELLLKLVEKHAKEKNFERAEALRERIYNVDPMALSAIIMSEELIEKEKGESIDNDHRKVWGAFYKELGPEEAHTFYYALKEATFGVDEFVFRQGAQNSSLYFIDFGQLKLIYTQRNDDLLIKSLSTGDIAGEDTFFSISICSSSLVTTSPVNLRYLEANAFRKLEEENPALTTKIERYCSKLPKTSALIRYKGIDRKEHRRVQITGPLRFQLFDASNRPTANAYKGTLWDISVGGMSFYIKANRKNALILLGRRILVKFGLSGGDGKMKFEVIGTIVAVINHHFNSYSVHLKFEKRLEESLINGLSREDSPLKDDGRV